MKNDENLNKEVYISLIFTESTASLLDLNLPHLDHLHPDDSNICLITPSEFKRFQDKTKLNQNKMNNDNKINQKTDEIYLRISSNTALFSVLSNTSSKSYYSDSSDEDLTVCRSLQDRNSKIFEATKVRCVPLLATARSMAHCDKLECRSNNIYISLLETDFKSSTEFLCRICHGGDSFENLLTPCRCRGTVAFVHLKCLERWLRESNHSRCELCQHHYKIVREPQHSIPKSILFYLRHPGDNLRNILLDLVAFSLYTPSAVVSTYMLMVICEHLVNSNNVPKGGFTSHLVAFSAIFGMAAIDFTYASWLLLTIQRNIENWREWYNSNSTVKVILPQIKLRPRKLNNRINRNKGNNNINK